MQRNPFKFLDSFTKEDIDLFYGREAESEEIFSRLLANHLLLIYGPSGSGKSSIVQCGVSNYFTATDWKPIFIRRKDNFLKSMQDEIEKQSLTPFKKQDTLTRKIYSLYLDFLTPIYLIFDQFEELFIFGDLKEKNEFALQIANLLEEEMNLHIIFIIREEYLAKLTEIEGTIPDIFQNRIRIEKMKHPQALMAIENPCKEVGLIIEDGVAESILTKLYRSGEIELSYLQVYLDKLYKDALTWNYKNPQISHRNVEQVGEIGDILQNFLEEQISQSEDPDTYRALLKTMISPQGTKKIITINHARNSLAFLGFNIDEDILNKMLNFLVERRIIKEFEEGELYELRHDALAEKINDWLSPQEKEFIEIQSSLIQRGEDYKTRRILLDEQFLEALLPYEHKFTANPLWRELILKSKTKIQKQKRSRKNTLLISIGSAALFIIFLVFSLWVLNEKEKVDFAYKEAQEQRELAEHSKNRSESLAFIAKHEREIADSIRKLEESARKDVEYHLKEANEQRGLAERAKNRSDSLAFLAKHEGDIADSLRIDAEYQKMIATAERDNAEFQEIIAIQENQKSTKVLSQLYFYNDKFALTVKKNINQYLYGYIDKQGNTVIPFKYEEASPFDPNTGFATVKRDSYFYLIDTTAQQEYLLSRDISELNTKVAALNLSYMNLVEIPKMVFKFENIKILLLSKNLIEEIPNDISKLADSLFFLDLSHNKIRSNTCEIWDLNRLTVLNLSYNKIDSIPSKIGNLKTLKELDLSTNQIDYLPLEIGNLKKLTTLNLANNKLTTVPVELGNLIGLTTLKLSYNELTMVPVELGDLKFLNELNLSNNKLILVPEEIGQLNNLTTLLLKNNMLETLPLQLYELKKLKELDLTNNNFTSMPAQIGSLESLINLQLSSNEISTLNEENLNLNNLEVLNLSYNKLDSISGKIGNLINLIKLDLSSNKLAHLPEEISNLKNLIWLNLSDNNFGNPEKQLIQNWLPNCEIIW